MGFNDTLKAALHASWDPRAHQWHVAASPACAATVVGLLDGQPVRSSQRVLELVDQYSAGIAARGLLDPDSPLPVLERELVLGRLWTHQTRGVAYVAESAASLLGFTMGGGKTATAVGAANKIGAQRVVIMCPNKVRGVWPREVKRWSGRSWHIVDGKRPPKRKGARFQDLSIAERVHETEKNLFDCQCGAQTHAAIWNYEMLVHEPAASWRPPGLLDMLIMDEGHRLKSPTGQMSKNAAEWVNFTKHRTALTGTPMPQYPWDIFGLYRALDPGKFGTLWTSFKAEYIHERERAADGQKFPVGILKEKQAEFAEKVHSIMYRPVIDLKLPGREHIPRFVELEPVARKEYDRLDVEMTADLTAFADGADEALTPKNILARMTRLAQFTGGTVPNDEYVDSKGDSGAKRRVSTAKADALAEFSSKAKKDGSFEITGGILDEIGCRPGAPGGTEPVIVYCQFHDDLDVVKGIAKKAGLRYAEISGRRSDGLTEASEMSPDADIVAVQIQSGGTGVDLTRSRYGIWYSKGHSLGDYDQAVKRQDRPGQTRPVVYIHLLIPDTIDVDIQETLVKRRTLIAVSMERRGLDTSVLGAEAERVEPMPELPDGSDRSGGAVVLPIDEFGHGVMAPRVAHQYRGVDGGVVADKATLAKFDLEDF
jgi:SNF2 family DNA or RNA helicase